MISVDTPIGFEWNKINANWVKNYLTRQTALLQKLTNGLGVDIGNMNQFQFQQLCQLMETTAEGRELRNKMFKAWRSKKSRDSDNGKKNYSFNLSIKAGKQLKKIAKNNPINQTLEQLIFAGNSATDNTQSYQKQLAQLTTEKKQLTAQLAKMSIASQSIEDEIQKMISSDLHVKELATLEKSQLIKKILLLKRRLKY